MQQLQKALGTTEPWLNHKGNAFLQGKKSLVLICSFALFLNPLSEQQDMKLYPIKEHDRKSYATNVQLVSVVMVMPEAMQKLPAYHPTPVSGLLRIIIIQFFKAPFTTPKVTSQIQYAN